MAMLSEALRETISNNEAVRDLYTRADREELAAFAGLQVTGLAWEIDMGSTFGSDVAGLSVEDLMQLRYELGRLTDQTEPLEDGTVESAIHNLVRIIECEIGGRWVR
jgi:hypothetical protein